MKRATRRRVLAIALLGLAVTFLRQPTVASAGRRRPAFVYTVDATRPYGPSWGTERPADLPAWARQAGRIGSAAEDVRRSAEAQGLGADFVRVIGDLAVNESNATYGLPARRPYDSARGWGVFQFQVATWQDMARPQFGCAAPGPATAGQAPWAASTADEVQVPVRLYACVWRRVVRDGGDALDASRGVWLWHSGSSYYREYLVRRGDYGSFAAAWEDLRLAPLDGRLVAELDRIDAAMRGADLLA